MQLIIFPTRWAGRAVQDAAGPDPAGFQLEPEPALYPVIYDFNGNARMKARPATSTSFSASERRSKA